MSKVVLNKAKGASEFDHTRYTTPDGFAVMDISYRSSSGAAWTRTRGESWEVVAPNGATCKVFTLQRAREWINSMRVYMAQQAK